MAEAFGGVYTCTRKHRTGLWFFDSKPVEYRCPRCNNGAMAKLEHAKNYSAGGKVASGKRKKGVVL